MTDSSQEGADATGEIADRRDAERKRTLQKGQLFYLDSGAAVECLVLDISQAGARLRPTDVLSCPNRFRLRGPDGAAYHCEVIWRDDQEIGVRFL